MQAAGFIDVQGLSLEYRWIAGKVETPILVLLHEGLAVPKCGRVFQQHWPN